MSMCEDKIVEYIPTKGYFHHYYQIVKEGEACPRFHFMVSAVVLGAVVQRKVWIQRGTSDTFPRTFPNPWIVLLAPQGIGHKSSSLSVGRRLLTALPEYVKPKMFAAKITPEALIKALACKVVDSKMQLPGGVSTDFLKTPATGLIYSSEFGTFLGREKYNEGLVGLLTDLYDCPEEWSSETIMRGEQRLYNVCLTLLAASTPDWAQSMLPKDAFKTGFMSRIIIVTMPFGWDKRVADFQSAPEHRTEALKHMEEIAKVKGEMVFNRESWNYFENWYVTQHCKQNTSPGPITAYLERKQDHLLKLGTLLQLADDGQLTLQVENLDRALQILNTIEIDTRPMIEFIATEPKMRSVQAALELLRKHGELSDSVLLRLIWRTLSSAREYEDLIQLLMKSKMIKPITIGSELGYKYNIAEEK